MGNFQKEALNSHRAIFHFLLTLPCAHGLYLPQGGPATIVDVVSMQELASAKIKLLFC
jgi:hypothetical protein